MSAGVVDAKRFETVGEAEIDLFLILLCHPERIGQMTIETLRHSPDLGRV